MNELKHRADQMAVVMGRMVRGHGFALQGIGTPLAMAALALGKRVYEPDMQIVYTVGNVISDRTVSVRLCTAEWATIDRSLKDLRMSELICQYAPSLTGLEFMRPAQVDGVGNTNNVVIGDYESPRVRLAGSGGIGDSQVFNPNISFYVTRHDSSTLVDRVDFCSGAGPRASHRGEGAMRGNREWTLVTDRAVILLSSSGATLLSFYPGEDPNSIARRTGFLLRIGVDVIQTPEPTSEEMDALSEVDPLRIRDLELLSGASRRARLRELMDEELSSFSTPLMWKRTTNKWALERP